jgi:hypothetical protein
MRELTETESVKAFALAMIERAVIDYRDLRKRGFIQFGKAVETHASIEELGGVTVVNTDFVREVVDFFHDGRCEFFLSLVGTNMTAQDVLRRLER